MIELNINDMKDTERHSSKGNQLKWKPGIRQIILVMKV